MLFQFSLLLWLATTVIAWDHHKSVIVLIPDGLGPVHATLAREVARVKYNVTDLHYKLAFDAHITGTLQTKSANRLVTDSAAAGTALATGFNTNNGFIGINADETAVATVLEGARALGYNTGLVTTTRITHATPASFAAHVRDRDNEASIAQQYLGEGPLGRQVDLLWGGGRGFFLPQSTSGSSRKDERNLIEEAKGAGYTYLANTDDLKAYKSKTKSHLSRRTGAHLPSLGLFTRSHMSYEIDRNATVEPSLADMATGALDALNDKPFFLMVEGGRIDHAAHANDAPTTFYDVMAYEEMYRNVIEWVDAQEHPDKYVVLAMADHDTGGAVLPSNWEPKGILNATNSVEYLNTWVNTQVANISDTDAVKLINDEVLVKRLGLAPFTDTNIAEELLDKVRNNTQITGNLANLTNFYSGLVWGTGGHSEVDVNVGTYPYNKEFSGNHANVFVAQFIQKLLGLDLDPIHKKLETLDLGGLSTAADE